MTLDAKLQPMLAPSISYKHIAEQAQMRGWTITRAPKPHKRWGIILYDVHNGTHWLGSFTIHGLAEIFPNDNP